MTEAATATTEASTLPALRNLSDGPVTPWRQRLKQGVSELAELIQANADPEDRFRLARDTAEDVTQKIKSALLREFGCVFDPIHDGPALAGITAARARKHTHSPEAYGIDIADAVLRVIKAKPGCSASDISIVVFGVANATVASRIYSTCNRLLAQAVIRREGVGRSGAAYSYFPADHARAV
jgi:hypothetical protein